MIETNINYGENLKQNRLIRGITLKDLEKATGINNGNISRWERGEVLPNIDFCVKLADFYGITVDELIGHDNNETKTYGNKYHIGTINNNGKMEIK